jgi:putative ABC transport system substrate-binding protein
MKRREFIAHAGAAAAAWPLVVRAQERTARVGVLMVIAESDPESKGLTGAFEMGLDAAGWHKAHNIQLTYRWGASNPDLLQRYAEELIRETPDILVAFGTPALISLHQATETIPIVFAAVSDPIGQGLVASFSHPGGNLTGFSNFDTDIGKQVAPAS